MAKTGDAEKRSAWQARLVRYRAGGLTIGEFCTRESVSVASFYYWSRRLGGHRVAATTVKETPRSAPAPRAIGDDADVVRFHLPAGAQIVVPAARLDVVRCIAECLTQATPVAGPAFCEVVVKPR